MFKKHTFRAAYAGAGISNTHNTYSSDNATTFSVNSESDDLKAFANSHRPNRAPNKSQKPSKKNEKVFEFNFKTMLIAVAAVVALILIVALVFVAANSSGRDIEKENNTYISYSKGGIYYLAVNGTVLEETFENEIELVPALDNSFAYVFENTPDGYVAYILEKKKLTEAITSPVDEIIAYADLEPGIIYKDGNNVNYHSNDNDDIITRNDATASNFIISQDASAVAYTVSSESNANESKLFMYANGVRQSYATNMVPVAVSKGGKHLYAYGISSSDFVTKNLYLIKTLDEEKTSIDSNFYSTNALNIKGDELVYSVITEKGYQTKIYNAKKEKTVSVGGGICLPMMTGNTIKLATFKSTVFENTYIPEGADRSNSATYFVNNAYKSEKISKYNGALNSDGDVFYYIDVEDTLCSIEIGKKNAKIDEIALGVVDFVITEKDSLYYLDDSKYLWFDNPSSGKRQIETQVSDISFNIYSNTLYFEIIDDEYIYSTEEGSGKVVVEFAKDEIDSIPGFIDNGLKRTFTLIYDEPGSTYSIYYTSTGKSFKLIDEGCDSIY